MNTLSPAQIAQTTERNAAALNTLRNEFDRIASVDIARLDWRAMLEMGALVSLKVSRYRGIMALAAADLGLDAAEMDQVKEIVNLGSRLLLPASVLNEFNAIETRARQVVRAHTMLTPFGLFITPSAWNKLAATIAPFKDRFEQAVDRLLVDLDLHFSTMRQEYTRLAEQVVIRLERANQYIPYNFEREFVDRCMLAFPSSETLRSKFAFNLELSFVPLSYDPQPQAPSNAAASDDLLNLRRQVLEEQAATRQQLVNEFLNNVQSEVFTLINSSMVDVLAAIDNNNGALAGRSSVQLRNLIERLNDLNFWNDPRVELMTEKITEILDRSPAQRDQSLTRATIDEIASRSRQAILTIERQAPINVSVPAATLPAFNAAAAAPRVNLATPRTNLSPATNRGNRPF